MNKKIKMVGLDLDGTLLTTEKKITENSKEAIRKAIDQGVTVLVSTGRPITAVPQELLEFPGMKYAVTANGARIMNVEENKVLHASLLSLEVAEKVLQILGEYDVLREICVDGISYAEASFMDRAEEYYRDPSMVAYTRNTRIKVDSVMEKLRELNQPVDKVHGIFKHQEEKYEADAKLKAIPEVFATGSLGYNLEVMAEGTNKGNAMLKLGELLGIQKEEIMACGDGMNDYDMLNTVGFAVVMENGHERLKALADHITASNDDDGVAKAIEQFVIKGE